MYIVLALIALWGAFCVTMVWLRVGQKRFRSEEEQDAFIQAIEGPLVEGNFDAVEQICAGDVRAMPQLVHLAVAHRDIGYSKVRQLLLDRFDRDVLADLDHRISWINTVIKSAPMVGLLGTVLGMMGAFSKLAAAESVQPSMLASDIMLALITTACGLSIAIPLIICMASINIRIRKMEDLVSLGLTEFFDLFRAAVSR